MVDVVRARIVALLVCLCATTIAGQQRATSEPPPASEAADAPFTTGISTPETLEAAIDARLGRARQLLDAMLAVTGPRTVDNTLVRYDEMIGELQTAGAEASLFGAAHPDAAMRKAGDALDRRVSAVVADIQLRFDVYAALGALRLGDADGGTRYYVQRELRDFRRMGVDRPAPVRERLKVLRDELTDLLAQFQRNVREGRRTVVVRDTRELEGLPPDFVARHTPDAAGAITLTSDTVDARPVMSYADNEDLRRRMYLAMSTVAAPENLAVFDRILAVRAEIAGLLGYPNWASYDTASRMAGDVKTVSAFIDRVVAAAGPKAASEYEQLAKIKRQAIPGSTLQVWDRQRYAELARKASYDFDSQRVRPYFAFERVMQGLLDVTSRIFGVSFREVTGVTVWHPSVRVLEMRDHDTMLGRVYLDLHPRAGKVATTAFVIAIRPGAERRHLPEAALVASLPGGHAGDPGLMTHDEVRTLFHEFGHVLHRIIGGHQRWQGLSSVAMERDFAEAPSQMLEEWVWDPSTLAGFARHHQTGEPIPADLVAQMRRAAEFGQGLEVLGQMVFARASLSYHDRDPKGLDTTALWKEIHNRYLPYPHVDGTHRQAAFTHLGNPGYASAYYTYMWSLVIAKDLFSGFAKTPLTAPDAARRYRQAIFEPGSSRPASDAVRDFLGRPFGFEAWEAWLNGTQNSDRPQGSGPRAQN